MRKFLVTLIAVTVLATACSGDDGDTADPTGPIVDSGRTIDVDGDGRDEIVIDVAGNEIVLTAGLNRFDECEALLDHLRTEYADRVGPWGFEDGGWYGPAVFLEDDVVFEEAVDVAAGDDSGEFDAPTATRVAQSADAGAALTEGVEFSGTNVQETGVDEADIVKTDGRRVYVVSAGQLVVVDVAGREVLGTADVFDGWRSELFLSGDELLLIGQGWVGGDDVRPLEPAAEVTIDSDELIAPPGYGSNSTVIQRIHVAGDGDPEVIETLAVEGDYVSARSVDGVARVIIQSHPQQNFPFVYPQSERGEQVAEQANRQAVLDSELTDWLPSYAITRGGTRTDSGLLTPCDSVHAPTEFSGFGVTSVLSLAVDGELDASTTTAVLAPGDTVYASTGSLYVSTTTWLDPGILQSDADWETAWGARRVNIHRFDITGPEAVYTASGSVPGEIRDQFSLSEHEGHLRVVTTTGDPWGESSESQVRVLQETDGELVEVASVGDIGNGEQVQSVRFVGDIGYVVTFRQVDPFYTIDLSDPTDPRVVGELKIPGFSSYLHPIGDGLVLGVGTDATEEGRTTGAKVSLFDVSDPADPTEIAVWTAPDGWNDVGWDHRSFLWWEPESLAVIPVTLWAENWSGAVVLRVDGGSLTEVGRIDHTVAGEQAGVTDCRILTEDDIADPGQSELDEIQYLLSSSTELLVACDQDEQGVSGYECYSEPFFAEEAERVGLVLAPGERIDFCYQSQQLDTIVRSIAIEDGLWTLSFPWGDVSGGSHGRLQVNDLTSLDRVGAVQL